MSAHLPKNKGRWKNPEQQGNSIWFPDLNCIPEGSNDPNTPYTFKRLMIMNFKKPFTFREIFFLKKLFLVLNLIKLSTGSIGIRFIDNEPNFQPFSIATVKVKPLLDCRYGSEGTMPLADKILAKRLGIAESKVRQWINDNQYVWHERQNGKHIDLLTHDIHGNIPHTGGISMNKKRNEI
ncbi:MAG: hypothetical protein Ta2B_14770 [Termitinemataceae bacterium]|nr:MAG: hypothetical protein Ta2B_14770 [Termitinemataceae bacterium]